MLQVAILAPARTPARLRFGTSGEDGGVGSCWMGSPIATRRPEVEVWFAKRDGQIKSLQCTKLPWTCAFIHQTASWLQWLQLHVYIICLVKFMEAH
jgi:hypothetical protein